MSIRFFWLVACVVGVSLLSGCSERTLDLEIERYVGVWEFDVQASEVDDADILLQLFFGDEVDDFVDVKITLTLTADGTYAFVEELALFGVEQNTISIGRWAVEGDDIRLIGDETGGLAVAKLSGGMLVIDGAEGAEATFKRRNSPD